MRQAGRTRTFAGPAESRRTVLAGASRPTGEAAPRTAVAGASPTLRADAPPPARAAGPVENGFGAAEFARPGAGAGARLLHHDGRGDWPGVARSARNQRRPAPEDAVEDRRNHEPG